MQEIRSQVGLKVFSVKPRADIHFFQSMKIQNQGSVVDIAVIAQVLTRMKNITCQNDR